MSRIIPYRPRNPDADNLEERYRGFVTLDSPMFPSDEARNREAERWAAEDQRIAESDNRLSGSDLAPLVPRPAGIQVAQAAIPIPRRFPFLPSLLYDRGRRGSPPRGPGPQSRRKSDGQCYEEYTRNLALCDSYYPKAQFPGLDLDPRGRGLCKKEAFRVFSDCETGYRDQVLTFQGPRSKRERYLRADEATG